MRNYIYSLKREKKTVFLFTGGSGGHIKPALILKERLESNFFSPFLFWDRKFPGFNIENSCILHISRNKFYYLIQLPLIFLFILIKSLIHKADIFIGFGGYYTLPGIIVAKLLKAKAIIYEPNIVAGRANKLLSYICDYIFILWPESIGSFPPSSRKKIVKIKPLVSKISVSLDKKMGSFSLVISGGSKGSYFLNKLFWDLILNYKFKNKNLEFVLITGREFYTQFKKIIKEVSEIKNLKVEVLAYCDDMGKLYRESDLLISRAGAQTLVESIYCLLPAIFIPYPYAYGHQEKNTEMLYRKGACLTFKQEFIDWKILGDCLVDLQENPQELARVRHNLQLIKENLFSAESAEQIISRI